MHALFTLDAFWLTYGVLIENCTLIVTNIFTLFFAASVLILILKIRQVLQTRASLGLYLTPLDPGHTYQATAKMRSHETDH